MFTSSSVGFLNIDCVGWFPVLTSVSFDINRETNTRIDVVVFAGSKVIDKKLSIAAVLNGIRDNLYGWIITWNHTAGSVDHGS